MNVLVLNSSPHKNEQGTGNILNPFIKGMKAAGADVEIVFVNDLNVKPCLGCFSCWGSESGECVHDDDMTELLPKMQNADIQVLATPVYVDGMTGPLKTVLDRSIPLVTGRWILRDGHCRHPLREGKEGGKLVLLSVCGFTELDNFDPLIAHVKALCKNMNCEYVGAVLRPYSWALPLIQKAGVDVSLVYEAAEEAGRQVIAEGTMEEETLQKVAAPFVPKEVLVDQVNRHFS
ncbi:MAG: flavodoxin family protein [Candidatus Thorarchaeota archaeon]